MNFVAIDFETANRYPNSACSVGLVKVEQGQITEEYYTLIKPPKMIFDPMNVSIHGIKASDVKEAPAFDQVWQNDLEDFIGTLPLVAHNASFDMNVLRALLTTYALEGGPKKYACTVNAARKTYPELPNHKLSTVAEHLGIPLRHHQALDDAKASALIMIDVFKRHEKNTFEALCVAKGICLKLF